MYAKQSESNKKCLGLGKVCTQTGNDFVLKYLTVITKFPDNSLIWIKWLKFPDKSLTWRKFCFFPTHGNPVPVSCRREGPPPPGRTNQEGLVRKDPPAKGR